MRTDICGRTISFPPFTANVNIRLRIASSRLISPADVFASNRRRVYDRTSAVVRLAMRRPPKYGARCSLIRRFSSPRPPAVDDVFGFDVRRRLVESEPAHLPRHRYAVRHVSRPITSSPEGCGQFEAVEHGAARVRMRVQILQEAQPEVRCAKKPRLLRTLPRIGFPRVQREDSGKRPHPPHHEHCG